MLLGYAPCLIPWLTPWLTPWLPLVCTLDAPWLPLDSPWFALGLPRCLPWVAPRVGPGRPRTAGASASAGDAGSIRLAALCSACSSKGLARVVCACLGGCHRACIGRVRMEKPGACGACACPGLPAVLAHRRGHPGCRLQGCLRREAGAPRSRRQVGRISLRRPLATADPPLPARQQDHAGRTPQSGSLGCLRPYISPMHPCTQLW